MKNTRKTYYIVNYFYAGKRLAKRVYFDRYSDALEFAKNAAKDEDNTEIYLTEETLSGYFKKRIETKTLLVLNEF